MFKLQLQQTGQAPSTILLPKPVIPGHLGSPPSFTSATPSRRRRTNGGRISASSTGRTQVSSSTALEKAITVKADVIVKLTVKGLVSNMGLHALDDITDLMGKSLYLELISSELDPKSGQEKERVKAYAHKVKADEGEVTYEATFEIGKKFGEVGGILVTNEHRQEMYLSSIKLKGFPDGDVNITCNSWVHAKSDNPESRIFFTEKSYLPSETPNGLKLYRAKELNTLRGDGQGERKSFERIYDYDTYNDLGSPDNVELVRPVLGGEAHPYPRRCRTGRPRTKKDPETETRTRDVYVPRDETFSEVKMVNFQAKTLRSVLHALLPSIETLLVDKKQPFPYFTAIDSLYNEGILLPKEDKGIYKLHLPRLVKAIKSGREDMLLFETPEMIERDKFSWFRDEEFSRQTLAGLNPMSIQLVTEFPMKSKLDPEVYGNADSLITKEIIEREIKGFSTLEEALAGKRLFVLDYHDLLLPYVEKVRGLEETTLYGSRTLFFLTDDSTLRPLAIELTRPKTSTKPQWRQVFTPGWDATSCWLWKLAKTHVCAHDSGYHQLVIHWLRTHCCTEPFIIATNRQLSAMHPIFRLLHPHFRYTMEINALAREDLINAGGVIEGAFFPQKYAIELSSVAYDKLWRFDLQGLPADLISRGMAVEDPTAENGLKLTIKDYPFANDGLLLWSCITEWVQDYVNHYYPDPTLVASDPELQAWWTEIQTKGHPDKKEGWPTLNTTSDLVQILATIIWITSGHHAAVNFGQYGYAGYFPNRPTIARTNMPVEDNEPGSEEFDRFLKRPETVMLECFPSQLQATKVISVLDVLSTHSPDEEYLGEKAEGSWAANPIIAAAFERFNGRLKEIEGIIDARNEDWRLKNRTGAGVMPYQLLKPYSKPGVTSMGVPNSISI